MSGRSPPSYCTLTILIVMQGHQKNSKNVHHHTLFLLKPRPFVQSTFDTASLRAFGINADQWTTAAQDEGGWHGTTAEQGAERFMVKLIAAEKAKAGLHSITACSRMPERDGKDQEEEIPKQAGSCWFARPCGLAASGANLYPRGLWFADVMTSLWCCYVCFVLLRFRLYAFVEASALRPIVLRYNK